MNPPSKGDLFELIELAATCLPAQAREFEQTLNVAIQGRGYPGTTYGFRRLNARVIEVIVHGVKGVRKL